MAKIPEFRDFNLVVEIERCIAKIPRESLGQIQDPLTSFLVIQHAQWVPQTHRMVPETSVAQRAPLRPQLWMDSGWMDLIVFLYDSPTKLKMVYTQFKYAESKNPN